MDYLDEIFKMQKKLEAAIGADFDQRFITLSFVGIITEACEALENTPWKPWKQSTAYNKIEFQKELIDLLHFVVNLLLVAGMEPEDVYRMYKDKHEKNMKRNKKGY